MSDNMNDKNENLDETVVDETVVDETAETASNETVDDVATDDIAADASSADSIESIDFAVVYDDDNADIEIAATDGAEISRRCKRWRYCSSCRRRCCGICR